MHTTRKATSADIEPLSILFDQYRVFYKQPSDLNGARTFLKERFHNSDSEIYVSTNAEKDVTGFMQLYSRYSSTRMKRLWLLNDLFVAERFRQQGYSIALISKAQALCMDTQACALILETERSNEAGNSLYPKVGFVLDTKHNFYSWEPGG